MQRLMYKSLHKIARKLFLRHGTKGREKSRRGLDRSSKREAKKGIYIDDSRDSRKRERERKTSKYGGTVITISGQSWVDLLDRFREMS